MSTLRSNSTSISLLIVTTSTETALLKSLMMCTSWSTERKSPVLRPWIFPQRLTRWTTRLCSIVSNQVSELAANQLRGSDPIFRIGHSLWCLKESDRLRLLWMWGSTGQRTRSILLQHVHITSSHRHRSHNVSFHRFADDTQLYIGLNPKTPEDLLSALNQCSTDILSWFTNNGLSLNPTKSEVLFLGTRTSWIRWIPIRRFISLDVASSQQTVWKASASFSTNRCRSTNTLTWFVKICYFHIRA